MTETATASDTDHHRTPGTPPVTSPRTSTSQPPDALGALADQWGHRPGVLRVAAPLDADQAHALAVTCSDPFRSGTQAHAVTRVRFHTTAGRLVAPGDLLPRGGDGGDHGVADYLDRVRAQLPGQGWLYSVGQPLHQDATGWLRVRAQLAALWRHVGHPAAPVSSEVAIGAGYRRPPALAPSPEDAVLVWVLHGEFAVRLRHASPTQSDDPVGTASERAAEPASGPASDTEPLHTVDGPPDLELHGTAGDLLYWPAGYHSTEEFPGAGAVLRITVPETPHRVRHLLEAELSEAAGGHVPEDASLSSLPHRAGQPAGATTPVPALAPLHDIAGALDALLSSREFEAALHTRWALRRSTAGVEPAPGPAPASSLNDASALRVTGRIVPVEHGDQTVWAVNGHPLPLAGDSARALHARLTEGRELTVAELCREIGAPPGHPQVVDLLRTLDRLRAVRVLPTPADPATPADASTTSDPPAPATTPLDVHEDPRP